jgi:hypothetical protein
LSPGSALIRNQIPLEVLGLVKLRCSGVKRAYFFSGRPAPHFFGMTIKTAGATRSTAGNEPGLLLPGRRFQSSLRDLLDVHRLNPAVEFERRRSGRIILMTLPCTRQSRRDTCGNFARSARRDEALDRGSISSTVCITYSHWSRNPERSRRRWPGLPAWLGSAIMIAIKKATFVDPTARYERSTHFDGSSGESHS